MRWTIEVASEPFKCYICKLQKPKGSLSVIYLSQENPPHKLRWVCIYHKLCQYFVETGSFCQNHEDGMDVECNEVPF